MPYIHINKETKKVLLFGNLAALAVFTKLNKNNLLYLFSRKKLKEVETDKYIIYKRKYTK